MKIKKHCCVLIFVIISVLCVCFSAGCNFSEYFSPNSTEDPANESHEHDYDYGFEHFPSSKDDGEYSPNEKPVVSIPAPQITESNIEILKDIKPIFSVQGGFYIGNPSVSVFLSASDAEKLKSAGITDYSIKLSFNQEEPSSKSQSYEKELKLPFTSSVYDSNSRFTTSILRAAVYDSKNNLIGKIETATYIKSQRSENVTLPVVSLVTNSSNLYDQNRGIIPNYNARGAYWERPVHFEFIEKDTSVLSQDAGIRIFGGSSRTLTQKSFRITARKSSYFNVNRYDGAGKFKYALFPGRLKADGTELAEFDSFVLRNGGNDSILHTATQNIRTSMLRDGLVALITGSASKNIDYMEYRPVVVILNGEYYGILNMREHENDNYISNVYGIEDKENITVISSEVNSQEGDDRYNGSWFYYKQDSGPDGELDKYIKLLSDIKAGKYTFEQASQYIDMDNFLEYCAINIFVCNTDWPHNNVRVWKYSDGKYKFMLRDADLGMARYTVAAEAWNSPSELYTKADAQNLRYLLWPCLTEQQKTKLYNPDGLPHVDAGTYNDPLYTQSLLNFCLKNDIFREKFVDYCEKLATELWTPEHLNALLLERKAVIEIEMQYHFNRWSKNISETFYSYWAQSTVNESMKQWMTQRSGANGYFLKEIYEVCKTY